MSNRPLFHKTLTILFLSLFFITCGKQVYNIGHENPELEIKKCIALSQSKRYQEAVECLEIFKSRFPQTPQGQEAELRIADNYYHQNQFLLAADAYLSFVKLHPAHENVDYALYRAGLSYFKEAPKAIDRDQQYLVKAIEQFKTALQVSPQSIYHDAVLRDLSNAENRMAKRIYYIGHFYYRTHEDIASALRFKELVDKFPHATYVPKSLYYLTESNLKLGRTEEARQAVEKLVSEFPKNRWTSKAQKHYLHAVKK